MGIVGNSDWPAIFDLKDADFLSALKDECGYWVFVESNSHKQEIAELEAKKAKLFQAPIGLYLSLLVFVVFLSLLVFAGYTLSLDFDLMKAQYESTGELYFRGFYFESDVVIPLEAYNVVEALAILILFPFQKYFYMPVFHSDLAIDSFEGQLELACSLFSGAILLAVPLLVAACSILVTQRRISKRRIRKIDVKIEELRNDASKYVDPLHANVVPVEFRRADLLCALLVIVQRGEAHSWEDALAVYNVSKKDAELRRRMDEMETKIKKEIRKNRPIVHNYYYH